ncbi:hypothetical protein DSC45_26300 [Streptomyces sp. YIM 130001]|uniref:hypothetical protein n=1 Tax=Streptomyces sp. YIM 130001 TaxID=2259644 RepID=UPI000EEA6D0B|nr:hypothetical protein [Streptomyces sp. YIM 130001]RII12379.1 hypothetical protein DSC45_26300 [Streptomyces sp. YIM 130001]
MKALLWFVLVCSLAFNVSTSFMWSGGTQVAFSVVSGVVFLGSAFSLWLLRDKEPRSI